MCYGRHVSWDLGPILAAVAKVPWLTRLGAPIEADETMPEFGLPLWPAAEDPWTTPVPPEDFEVERLPAFDAWEGPDEEGSVALSKHVSVTRDELITSAGWLRRRRREAAFERVRAYVIELAAVNVPSYESNRDSYYAPNVAVWSAATVAGLMAVYRLCGKWPDAALENLWRWYRRGHWPAAYLHGYEEVAEDILVVY
jgi:hypothetical protein